MQLISAAVMLNIQANYMILRWQ